MPLTISALDPITATLAAAAHDLRQPLRALLLLLDQWRRAPTPAAREELGVKVIGAGESVDALLRSVSELAQLGDGSTHTELHRVTLKRLCGSALVGYHERATLQGLRLLVEVPDDLVVQADPCLLDRVLRNLVDNAVKYSATGTILVSARSCGNVVHLSVQDEGVGIPPQDLLRVREPRFRGRAQMDHAVEGLGLGLCLVERMCERMGAHFDLSSQPGVGTLAQITLGRASVQPCDSAASSTASAVQSSKPRARPRLSAGARRRAPQQASEPLR